MRQGLKDLPHDGDFLPLFDDDALSQPAEAFVFTEAQLSLGHLDRTLMMRNHHGRKVPIHVSHSRQHHGGVHAHHRSVHKRLETVGLGAGGETWEHDQAGKGYAAAANGHHAPISVRSAASGFACGRRSPVAERPLARLRHSCAVMLKSS